MNITKRDRNIGSKYKHGCKYASKYDFGLRKEIDTVDWSEYFDEIVPI